MKPRFKLGDLIVDEEGNKWQVYGFMGVDNENYLLQLEYSVNEYYDLYDTINKFYMSVDKYWQLDLTDVTNELVKKFLES